jgi:hypothetical protein
MSKDNPKGSRGLSGEDQNTQQTRCCKGWLESSGLYRSSGSLGEHSDHIVTLRWCDPLPGMLFTIDLILYKEMALLF